MDENVAIKKRDFTQIFAALKHRNFRLFWIGQCISLIGTWMQNLAQSWLVLELTNSAFWLGFITTMQFLPMMLFSLHAGTLIDRFSKKRMLIFTQTAFAILAIILAVDDYLGTVQLWHIIVLAGLLGCVNTLDMPARQAFMVELVGKQDLTNAIVLNSAIFNGARVVGPSIAGFVIARTNIAFCFFINAVSFVPVIAGIAMITVMKTEINMSDKISTINQDIKEGLCYIVKNRDILEVMLLLAFINIFAMNFSVIIPLYVKEVFKSGAQAFGFLMSATGIGALAGAFYLAARSTKGPNMRYIILSSIGMAVSEMLLAPINNILAAYLILGFIGVFSIAFTTMVNSLIQTKTPDNIRGRVMSIYTLIFGGLTPIGSFITGAIAEKYGAPATIAIEAAISIFLIAAILAFDNRRNKEEAY